MSDSKRQCAAFQNEHFSGFATFEDRSGTYLDLVHTIIHRRAALGPGCRYIGGTSLVNWLAQSTFLLGSMLLLAAAIYFFWSAVGWMILIKLVIIAWMVPLAFRWVARNMPREFDPSAIPDQLLPRLDPAGSAGISPPDPP